MTLSRPTLRVVITVGLPGSGKSTYLASLGANAISSDAIRIQLADDVTDQTIHRQVFATARYLLRQRFDIGRPVTYIDATNLTPFERRPWIETAKKRGCAIEAIYFKVPLEVCQARNAARSRIVPPEAMQRMAKKLKPPTESEGFDKVTVITG